MSKATMNTQDAVSANFAECFVTIDGTRYSMLMAKEFEGTAVSVALAALCIKPAIFSSAEIKDTPVLVSFVFILLTIAHAVAINPMSLVLLGLE